VGHLQRLPDQPVKPHPPRGRQALVQHLADQRVREPPAAQPARDRTDHPGRLGLLQQLQQPPGVQAAGRLQHPQLEVAARHRGNLQDSLAAAGQATQPLGDHRPDTLRQARRQHRRAQLSPTELPLAGEQPHDLGDEERVAVGLPVHRRRQPRQLRRRRHLGHQGDEAGHLLEVQPAEQQPVMLLAARQIGHRRHQRMSLLHLCVPVAAHHQDAGTLQLAAHKAQ
jgi:hypothetical protein